MTKNIVEKKCDVLCIGGGGAGVTASVSALDNGANVILVSKELIGYGNTRLAAGGIVYTGLTSSEDTERFFKDLIIGGEFLNNQPLSEIMAREAPEATIMLERFGILVARNKDGMLPPPDALQFGGHSIKRTIPIPSAGVGIGQALRSANVKSNIEALEETIVTKLLTNENQEVVGAICLNLKFGKTYVISAKKTILATGGGGWIYYPYTDNTRAATGDGYALAYDVGAELIDMEHVQFVPFAITHPKSMVGLVCGEPYIAGPKGKLLNEDGKEILSEVSKKTRAQVAKAIILEVEKGKGTSFGGAILDLRENKGTSEGEIIYSLHKTVFKTLTDIVEFAYGKKAADWQEPWDVYPTAHYFMGGIRVDENGSVPLINNLYAIGEVSGGLHGANRLGSVSLAELFVFGQRAGRMAALSAKEMDQPTLNKDQINIEVNRIHNFIGKKGSFRPIQLKREIQTMMWKLVGPARSEEKLKAALEQIEVISEKMDDVTVSNSKCYNFELLDVLELPWMLIVAKAIALSALKRRETRGAHVRVDYPNRDDEEWLKNVIIRKGDEREMKIRLDPVELTKIGVEGNKS